MFGYGVSYAIASLSCTIGPFLAVTAAGLRSGSVLTGVAIYLAYVGGLTLVVGVLALAAATASSAVAERLRRILPFVNRISGALLVWSGCTSPTTASTSCGCSVRPGRARRTR